MPRIFISYRREDSIGITGRICDRLGGHFGRDSVFMDVDGVIRGGSWNNYAEDCTASYGNGYVPGDSRNFVGFHLLAPGCGLSPSQPCNRRAARRSC